MFPDADVPIIPISVAYDMPPEFHFELGKVIAEIYPSDDTLFISSGNIVHNLSNVDWENEQTPEWAKDFDT